MATFLMLGKYSAEAVEAISAARTGQAVQQIQEFSGEVRSIYALLGENGLALIVDFSGIEQAMKASVALSRTTGVSFTTAPAASVEDFDKMMAEM
jgi:uncharacterized protein with GYD domain